MSGGSTRGLDDGTVFRAWCHIRRDRERIECFGSPLARFGYGDTEDDSVSARWRAGAGELRVEADAYGLIPIFYYRDRDQCIVGSHLVDVLARCPDVRIDDEALAVFLRVGFLWGARTPFSSIRTLMPGEVFSWRAGEEYTPVPVPRAPPTDSMARSAAQSEYAERLDRALASAVPDGVRPVVPLSGGRDSRHLLLSLVDQGFEVAEAVTMRHLAPKPDEDARVAALLAEAVGVEHIVLDPPRRQLAAERRKNVLTHFGADEHRWILPLRDYLSKSGARLVFDGLGGDVLSAGLFLDAQRLSWFRSGDFESFARDLVGDDGYLPKILPRELYGRWSRDAAISALADEARIFADWPNPVGAFFFFSRTRREIATSAYHLLGGMQRRTVTPFVHRSVADFLLRLPADHFLDHTFHEQTIARRFPEYGDIPYERKGVEAKAMDLRGWLTVVGEGFSLGGATARGISWKTGGAVTAYAVRALLSPGYAHQFVSTALTPSYLNQLLAASAAPSATARELDRIM